MITPYPLLASVPPVGECQQSYSAPMRPHRTIKKGTAAQSGDSINIQHRAEQSSRGHVSTRGPLR